MTACTRSSRKPSPTEEPARTPGLSAVPSRRARLASLVLVIGLACITLSTPAAAQTGGECIEVPSDPGICLFDDRFKVTVEWADFSGNPFTLPSNLDGGQGQGVVVAPSTPTAPADTGYFWFFTEDNIELVVKMIDGRQTNGAFWFFAGTLTDVEYRVHVEDTQTQAEATYENPPGAFVNIRDTQAFPEITPESGALPSSAPAPATAPALDRRLAILPAGTLPSCDAPHVACVQDGRFAIETVFDPGTGAPATQGSPVLATDSSALVSHIPESGVDTAVKVLDGREVNDEFCFFASGFDVLDGATPGSSDLTGFFDRFGFGPG